MSVPYTLDEIARTTDELAVRRRFDQRNRLWLQVLAGFFAFVAFINIVGEQRKNTPMDVVLWTANLAVISLVGWTARDSYRNERSTFLGRWLRGHMTAGAITYILLQYGLVLLINSHSQSWTSWAIALPWMIVAFRFTIAEHALLHSVFLGGALLMPSLGAPSFKKDFYKFAIAVAINNAFAIAAELFGSYRLRRQVRAEWNERRNAAREQIRMRDELRYARELQLSMLPDCAPPLGWAELCAISLPATEVGGDYYDYFVDGDRVALVCGDVAGHGMAAGLVLASLRSGFTLLKDSLDDPGAVLRRLHDLVAQTSRRRMLVTVTVVLLDRATRRATIASAGHPPVIVRRAGGQVETIDLFAPPLGVRLPVNIPQRQLDVASGDVFVLHSDGIYETVNGDGDTYGLERLEDVVRRHDGTAESLRDAILADVASFRGEALQHDDVTVVVAKIA